MTTFSATISPTEALALLKQEKSKLQRELDDVKSRRSGSYRLRMSDVADLGRAHREIERGEIGYGLRRLEDVLECLDPRWREL